MGSISHFLYTRYHRVSLQKPQTQVVPRIIVKTRKHACALPAASHALAKVIFLYLKNTRQ